MQNPLAEYNPELETFENEQFEQFEQFEWSGETTGEVLGESELLELAAELLEVRDEQELDRFLGSLIKKVGRAVGTFVKSPIGKAIGGVLKSVAKKALPLAGGALGTFVGGPLGAKIGSGLASMAGNALGLELEGLSQEDREFEAAKQFVRFASDAVNNAISAPGANPGAAAQAAIAKAARRYAPGLLRGPSGSSGRRAAKADTAKAHPVRADTVRAAAGCAAGAISSSSTAERFHRRGPTRSGETRRTSCTTSIAPSSSSIRKPGVSNTSSSSLPARRRSCSMKPSSSNLPPSCSRCATSRNSTAFSAT